MQLNPGPYFIHNQLQKCRDTPTEIRQSLLKIETRTKVFDLNNEKSPWNKYYYYYPVKIFFRFWLAKIPCTIHCPRWAKSRGDMLVAARVCRKVLTVEICSQPLKKKSRFAWSGATSWSRWVIKWWHFICSRAQARDFLGSRKTDYGAEWLLFSGHCSYSRVRSIGGAWTESLSLVEVCAAFPL